MCAVALASARAAVVPAGPAADHLSTVRRRHGSQDVCSGTAVEAGRPSNFQPDRTPAGTRRSPAARPSASTAIRAARLYDALWLNKARAGPDQPSRRALTTGASAIDIGEIAVVQDEGDLIESPNQYDLRNSGPALHPQRLRRLRRPPHRRRLPHDARHAAHADGRRQRSGSTSPFAFPFYGQTQTDRVRQLRRQHHVRAGGSREHRPQRRAPADRPAARRPVPRRSRPEHRRAASSQCRRRPVHGDVVRRARFRLHADGQRAADAAAGRLASR